MKNSPLSKTNKPLVMDIRKIYDTFLLLLKISKNAWRNTIVKKICKVIDEICEQAYIYNGKHEKSRLPNIEISLVKNFLFML